MMKSRLNSFGSCGSMVSARARFVDGPMTTPISSPGWACAASAQAWAADTALSGARGAGSRAYPVPVPPWVRSAYSGPS